MDSSRKDVTNSGTPDYRVHSPACYERTLGDCEVSYYLPGRANGVNDMYLHLGFTSPKHLVLRARVRAVWAILRMRHPLLASKVVMRNYDDVRFVFRPPASPEDGLAEADSQLDYRHQSKDGTPAQDTLPTPPSTPRTSSDTPAEPPEDPTTDGNRLFNYELFICAAHFIGDGMALHQFANDFFGMLGSVSSQEELNQLAADEWKQRWGQALSSDTPALPLSIEENLGTEQNRFRRAAGIIDFQNHLDRQIGGQVFPRRKDPIRHTIVPTTSFDGNLTKAMLKKCKAQGVSISSAMFAICNVAWARMSPREKQEQPMMMYAAMNIRSYFPKPVTGSYWFLSVGYFNVALPNFIPASCDVSKTFWHRARKAKQQSSRFTNSPMIVPRAREMAMRRGKQARSWAKEDDEKEAGVWTPTPRHPSLALIGLSLLGNLDGIYKHANFPDIKLHTLTTGSRQRNSAMLLFAYTFVGKLWISLGYDENGFERETVDVFWKNVHTAVHEFLVQ
ncbi:hypothetical protein BJV74DRAFT_877283 [Russula compacta]|nr:hypothetical protein BJV74DRAFT_877283 [Russula compacta]